MLGSWALVAALAGSALLPVSVVMAAKAPPVPTGPFLLRYAAGLAPLAGFLLMPAMGIVELVIGSSRVIPADQAAPDDLQQPED